MKNNNQTIIYPYSYDMISNVFPTYEDGILLHNKIIGYEDKRLYRKKILFNPNKISEINYKPGAHDCNPIGLINYYDKNDIFFLHYKNLSVDYVLNKNKIYKDRLSEINRRNGWGIHYTYNEQSIIDNFNMCYDKSYDISKIIEI